MRHDADLRWEMIARRNWMLIVLFLTSPLAMEAWRSYKAATSLEYSLVGLNQGLGENKFYEQCKNGGMLRYQRMLCPDVVLVTALGGMMFPFGAPAALSGDSRAILKEATTPQHEDLEAALRILNTSIREYTRRDSQWALLDLLYLQASICLNPSELGSPPEDADRLRFPEFKPSLNQWLFSHFSLKHPLEKLVSALSFGCARRNGFWLLPISE